MTKEIRVVIIDDHPLIRQAVRGLLSDQGHITVVGEGAVGDDVLLLMEEHVPDILLLDLNMPRKDGREALAEIKADPNLRGIPIVVLTTSKADEDIVRSYDLGANSYITKPVDFDGLVEALKTLGRYWFEIVELPPA